MYLVHSQSLSRRGLGAATGALFLPGQIFDSNQAGGQRAPPPGSGYRAGDKSFFIHMCTHTRVRQINKGSEVTYCACVEICLYPSAKVLVWGVGAFV